MADHDVTGGLTDIDAVIAIRGMSEDTFIFFIKRVHGAPGERDPRLQLSRIRGQLDMLPGSSRRAPARTVDHDVSPRSGCCVVCSARCSASSKMSLSGK